MSEESGSDADGIDRRSVLRRAGAVSALSLVGTTTATASEDDPPETNDPSVRGSPDERVLNEVSLDASEHDRIERASVSFLERGDRAVVRERVRTTHEISGQDGGGNVSAHEQSGATADAGPTKTTVSISMDPSPVATADSIGTDSLSALAEDSVSRLDAKSVADLDADQFAIESERAEIDTGGRVALASADAGGEATTVEATTAGVPDEPDLGSDWDGVAFVETNSSECGTLCRTNLAMTFDWARGRRSIDDSDVVTETVDGAACEGDEFGDRFPCWATPLYDCSVPDAFNTHWSTESSEHGRSRAEASYHNSDFPLIPDTYADHSVEAAVRNDGVGVYDYSVEHTATTGFGLAANYLLKSSYGAILY